MTREQLYKKIEESSQVIASGYFLVENHSGLNDDQIMEIYSLIAEEEERVDCLIAEYEKMTGIKLELKTKEDMLFENLFEKEFNVTDAMKTSKTNSGIPGNVRASTGMFRTDAEQEKYIEDSLERELP